MSHRKSDLGIPRPRKSAKVVLDEYGLTDPFERAPAYDKFVRSACVVDWFIVEMLALNFGVSFLVAQVAFRDIPPWGISRGNKSQVSRRG